MVLKNYRTISATQSYTGTAQTLVTDLPRDFLIQRVILAWTGTVTLSGTSVLVTDALLKCISAIRIKAVGEGSSRTIFEVSGKDLYNMNLFDYGSASGTLVVPTTTGASTNKTGFIADLRCNKLDPDDYSVALPSYLLSSLQLEIEYTAFDGTSYGTNLTSISNTMSITLVEGIPEAGEDFSSNPLMTVLSKQLSGDTSTGTEEDMDTFFQVGALIQRDFLITETSAGVRSDTEISEFSIKSGTIPLMSKINYDANKMKDIVNYRISEDRDGDWTVAGCTMIDFFNNRSPFIATASGLRIDGLSTVGYNTGDLLFTFIKNNASSIIRRIQTTIEG